MQESNSPALVYRRLAADTGDEIVSTPWRHDERHSNLLKAGDRLRDLALIAARLHDRPHRPIALLSPVQEDGERTAYQHGQQLASPPSRSTPNDWAASSKWAAIVSSSSSGSIAVHDFEQSASGGSPHLVGDVLSFRNCPG